MLTGINQPTAQSVGSLNPRLAQGNQAPSPEAELPALASSVEREVDRLEQTMSELANRLAPVRLGLPAAEQLANSPYQGSSPLGASFAAQAERIRHMSRAVRGLIEELAV